MWPEQTTGPYHRPVHPERRDITGGRTGLPLRVGLRLVDLDTGAALPDVPVEVWHADHAGRYSGFRPFHKRPGEVVTSASVPSEIVAPDETFLRGAQHTDARGMCMFETVYPGWYSSRTVHIHLAARIGNHRAVTQLYFPDELTDTVFDHPPYSGRPPRDTRNDTDSIFVDGGERSVLDMDGDPVTALTGVLCLGVAVPRAPSTSAGSDEVESSERRSEIVEAHVEAVGAADAAAVAALYARDAHLHDPAGAAPIVGRAAIAAHFGEVLTEPRIVEIVAIAVAEKDAAVHFRATPDGGPTRDVIDTMTFDDGNAIMVMRAYAT
jgi:protocatechuate 3,4-dioxygenase beta subunit